MLTGGQGLRIRRDPYLLWGKTAEPNSLAGEGSRHTHRPAPTRLDPLPPGRRSELTGDVPINTRFTF